MKRTPDNSDFDGRTRPSFREILKEREFWILNVVPILFYYRPLFLKETFFFRDLHLLFYPQRVRLLKLFGGGELPLWDPYLHGGQPFLGEIQNTALYPSVLLYFVFPLPFALNIEIVLHVLLCAASTYILARSLKLSPASSLIAGATYAYCGFSQSFINLAARFLALPYVPLLLLAWHLMLLERRKKWFALFVLFGVLQLFTGSPEIVLMSLVTALAWTLFFPCPEISWRRKIVLFGLAVLFIIGISSIQTLTAREMLLQSGRSGGYDYEAFSAWSLNPKRIPETVLTNFLGYTDRVSLRYYWGAKIEGMQFPYILSIYLGLGSVLLGLAGALSGKGILPYQTRLLFLLMILTGVILSLGRFLPFFPVIHEHIPLIQRFRYPIKFMGIAILPLALLAAHGSEALFHGDLQRKFRSLSALLWLIVAGLICSYLAFRFLPVLSSYFLNSYFGTSTEVSRKGLIESLWHASAVCSAVALIYEYSKRKRKTAGLLLTGVILLDLLSAAATVNPYAPQDFYTRRPHVVETVHSAVGEGRFFRAPNPRDIAFRLPSDDVVHRVRWNRETLENYTGAYYDIPVIFHENYDGLAKREIAFMADTMKYLPVEERISLLSAASVRLMLTHEKLEVPGIRLISKVFNRSNKIFYLYEIEKTAPRAGFVTDWIHVNSWKDSWNEITRAGFDPRRLVVLGSSTVPARSPRGECEEARISRLEETVNHSIFSVQNACDGYMVFSEPYFPGWRVTIDGKPAAIQKANVAFSAVFLSAGRHTVKRWYLPSSVTVGGAISFGSLLTLLALLKVKGLRI